MARKADGDSGAEARMSALKVIPPGSVIGILGGGQLGRMTAQAAAALGYHTHIYCQSADEPAAQVTNRVTLGSFDDTAALEKFARQVDVVTLEWENIPLEALATVNSIVPVYPNATALKVAQDRLAEKTFAVNLGVLRAEYAIIEDANKLAATLQYYNTPLILKTRRMGYDGKGQLRLSPGDDCAVAWEAFGANSAIAEVMIDFACEISVIVARRADGAIAAYPPVRNIHENGILAETHAPSGVTDVVKIEAETMARRMAEALGLVGLLAVEMFVLKKPTAAGQWVVMNEIAPRPHNSGHWTMDGCATSQFEQLVRAVCGLPLGQPHRPARRSCIIYSAMQLEIGKNGWRSRMRICTSMARPKHGPGARWGMSTS